MKVLGSQASLTDLISKHNKLSTIATGTATAASAKKTLAKCRSNVDVDHMLRGATGQGLASTATSQSSLTKVIAPASMVQPEKIMQRSNGKVTLLKTAQK